MSGRALSDGETALLAALEAGAAGASAAAAIRAGGLPTRRNEAWRWSDLRAALTPDVAIPPLAGDDLRDDDPIVRLAAAFGRLERVTVKAGETLRLDDRIGVADALDVRARRIEVEAGGLVERIVVQESGAVTLDRLEVVLGDGARFSQTSLAFGAKLARLETAVTVAGEGVEVDLASVALVGPKRHADMTSEVRHTTPGGVVSQVAKSAVREGGRAVFQGRFVVERAAQQTDARMRHDALLLDDRGEIDAKPELVIFADDVKCAHGNTVGALDPSALFYLRQRGLNETRARALLVEAFVAEAFERRDDDTRERLLVAARAWLEAGS